ncbi:mfs multidrug transporter protein [Rutstroemia sp. NJR-2017a WRK4]|nr:mfs multidrug transporter protein [Rutstroemia sp. NJR-2017a WRK4]
MQPNLPSSPSSSVTTPPHDPSPCETSSLLPHQDEDAPTPSTSASLSSPSLTATILTFMTLHFLLAFSEIILVAPLIKLFEQSLCLNYYDFPTGGVQEEWCKVPQVQGPLATIRGWKGAGDTLPDCRSMELADRLWLIVLLVAIPIGNLGDRYGRKSIMALSLIGVAASMVEIFVYESARANKNPEVPSQRYFRFSLFGFLPYFSCVEEVFIQQQLSCGLKHLRSFLKRRVFFILIQRRSHAFYYIFSAFYVAELVASYIASVTIDISPWIPCGMAICAVTFGLLLLWVMPGSQNPAETQTRELSSPTTTKPSIISSLAQAVSRPQVLFSIPVFLVGTLRYTTLNVLIQYSSLRFNTSISKGSLYYTETAIINIFLFLFLIPRVTAWVREGYHVRPESIDLALVRISVGMLLLGSLSIGLAPEKKWLPFVGSRVSTLSLISYYIPPNSKATLYASIAVLENLGHLVNDPSLQHIFAATLRLPAFWWGLPFFVAAICYFLAGVSTIFIRLDGHDHDGAVEEEPVQVEVDTSR